MSPIVHLEKHKKYSDFCECSMVYWNLEKIFFTWKDIWRLKKKIARSILFENAVVHCLKINLFYVPRLF